MTPNFCSVRGGARVGRPRWADSVKREASAGKRLHSRPEQMAGLDADKLAADLLKAGREKNPDYAFDCHTQKGRRMDKTKAEFLPR